MRHDECQACMGNVMAGMTCYACGLKGPKGEGWAFVAQDLKARVAELEALAAGWTVDRVTLRSSASRVSPRRST
jgi:hypothetical protein